MSTLKNLRCLNVCRTRPQVHHVHSVTTPLRSFHASRPNHIVPELLQASHWLFQEVHSVSGLPWALSIPLTAALARFSWFPIQLIIDRNTKRRVIMSHPLQAWRKIYRAQAVIRYPPKTMKAAEDAEGWVQAQLKIRQKMLEKDSNILPTAVPFILTVSFLPIWILNADVVRRMTGDTSTITSWLGLMPPGSVNSEIVPAEPGLATEGLPWITDLVSQDPYYILPLMFTFLSVINARLAIGTHLNAETRANIYHRLKHLPLGQRFRHPQYLMMNIAEAVIAASLIFPAYLTYVGASSVLVLYLMGSASAQMLQRPLSKLAAGNFNVQNIKPMETKAPQPVYRAWTTRSMQGNSGRD